MLVIQSDARVRKFHGQRRLREKHGSEWKMIIGKLFYNGGELIKKKDFWRYVTNC